MNNLVIDMGNTFSKIAIFNNRNLQDVKSYTHVDTGLLAQIISERKINHAIISSVDRDTADIENFLQSTCTYVRFSSGHTGRIRNNYKTPQTLGLDRLAAVIGAEALFPGKNVLVIDAGTCITYDMVDSDKNYFGGSISPGIVMRFNAVHTFTKRLPLVKPDEEFTGTYGYDTRSAIVSGVQQGAYHEMAGFISSYMALYPQLQVVLCGGDVKFFDSRLKSSIFAHSFKTEPHLVLIGLNEVIFQHND